MIDIYPEFKPISLQDHLELCLIYKEDAFICSFGSAENFYEADGEGASRYIEILRNKIIEIPESCIHVWHNGNIVGQIELGEYNNSSSIGYVNLFYLVPHYRGTGLSIALENYAVNFFRQRDFHAIRLSVSISNIPAVRFYLRQGWNDIGPRKDRIGVHYMEKIIPKGEADEK